MSYRAERASVPLLTIPVTPTGGGEVSCWAQGVRSACRLTAAEVLRGQDGFVEDLRCSLHQHRATRQLNSRHSPRECQARGRQRAEPCAAGSWRTRPLRGDASAINEEQDDAKQAITCTFQTDVDARDLLVACEMLEPRRNIFPFFIVQCLDLRD